MLNKGRSEEELFTFLAKKKSEDLGYDFILSSMCTVPHSVAVRAHCMFMETNLGDPGLFPGTMALEQLLIRRFGDLFHCFRGIGFQGRSDRCGLGSPGRFGCRFNGIGFGFGGFRFSWHDRSRYSGEEIDAKSIGEAGWGVHRPVTSRDGVASGAGRGGLTGRRGRPQPTRAIRATIVPDRLSVTRGTRWQNGWM